MRVPTRASLRAKSGQQLKREARTPQQRVPHLPKNIPTRDTAPMPSASRLIAFLAALVLTIASGSTHARLLDGTASAESARREIFAALGAASGEFAAATLSRVWEKSPSAAKSASDPRIWTYDKVGNRLTQRQTLGDATVGATEVATTYAYDKNDRLLTETTDNVETRYTYDANGNTLTKASPASLVEYSYDDANRLVEMKTDGARTTYRYDADGLRVAQTHFPATGPFVTTSYLQDPTYAYSQVIEEYTSENGAPKKLAATFTFADDLVAQTQYASAAPITRFVHADGFGSVRWLTDLSGAWTDTVDYDAFGNTIARTGSTKIEHLYRGEQFDANLGLYYLRARYYSAATGTFGSRDSFSGALCEPISLHDYLYAHDDPVNLADPSGLSPLVEQNIGITINTSQRARQATGQYTRYKKVKTNLCRVAAVGLTHGHHAVPVFLGGQMPRSSGNVVPLDAKFHSQFHSLLHYMLKWALPLGGNDSKADWEALYKSKPETRQQALTILVQAAKTFDKACQLKAPQKITPIIKRQIREGKWEF